MFSADGNITSSALSCTHRRHIVRLSSGCDIIGAILRLYPAWSQIKPLLVGWKKEASCCFHYSRGVPLHIIQLIIEFTWDFELPHMLVIPQ